MVGFIFVSFVLEFSYVKTCLLFLDSLNIYEEIARKMKLVKTTKGKYPDTSCKDVVVPPRYPVPKCPCGKPCEISQSKHPATAGRVFYMCSDSHVSFLIYLSYT